MISLYLPLVLQWVLADPGCIIVDHPQILAQDLARQISAFAALPSETTFGAAPAFGARRDLAAATLQQWAGAHNLAVEISNPICIFRRAARSEDIAWESELRDALFSLFQFRPAAEELSILETQLTPGAPGKLSLERSGLSFDPVRKHYVWRGKVIGEGLYASAKIRFRLSSTEQRLVTSRPIPAGRVLTAEDFAEVSVPVRPELPRKEKLETNPVGQVLRRSLPKGVLVLNQHLIDAPLIFPGDTVELLSRAGQALVRTQGQARNKARLGEPVLVSALETKRLIRAIAVGPGRVEIQTSIGKSLQ
ncbi:MAG: flagellar basal body P-ring formation chaperone FlgA [Cyanobacteria bacterium]|nr:flagellar basal body P-ring formation chaperone FlgA [Cyanobacteriota bacterium]